MAFPAYFSSIFLAYLGVSHPMQYIKYVRAAVSGTDSPPSPDTI